MTEQVVERADRRSGFAAFAGRPQQPLNSWIQILEIELDRGAHLMPQDLAEFLLPICRARILQHLQNARELIGIRLKHHF
jgi:hypothetical protein